MNVLGRYKNEFTKLVVTVISIGLMAAPHSVLALTLVGNSYQLENPTFTSGGGSRSSAGTYSIQDSAGGSSADSSSAAYQLQTGSIKPLLPATPAAPTLTNTGGTMYNTLDFVINTGGNASDTTFAIAISDDNFVTTNYVQATDTIGSTAVWQTYSAWGSGTGQRLVSLAPSTTYKIKVKARLGPGNETAYSNTASASTIAPSLTMTVAGVNSGTSVGGTTTNVTTTATTVPFGNLAIGSIKIGAQTVTVSTNAVSGYTTTVYQNHDLLKSNGVTIPSLASAPFSGTNASPIAWPGSITDARFGYHTTDSTLCTGTTGRFSTSNTFAGLTTSPLEIACSNAQVSNEATSIIYKVEVESGQAPGDYQNVISYITSPQY